MLAKLIFILYTCYATWKWFVFSSLSKGLLYFIGIEFGEEKMPNDNELKKIISNGIKHNFKIK